MSNVLRSVLSEGQADYGEKRRGKNGDYAFNHSVLCCFVVL